ncbi:MAG: T9SS type A sorting domain-containing protein [Bacteroidia bacterium]|nr:T9SS type A sorting domain-containing protein [Bacteroidia bacterium]
MTGTGGCNGGGGGGSSWVSPLLTAASFTAGDRTGHGQITIIYDIGVPTLTISGNNNVCSGSSTTLTASGSASTYSWSTGAQGSSIVITPTANTTYSVASQGTAACPAYGLYTVNIVSLPVVTATASPNYIICPGVPVTLSGGGADQYSWTGGVINATPFNASVTTAYTVTGTNNLTGCSNTAVVNVPVYTASVSVSPSSSICAGASANLSASGALSYTWSTGSQFPQISVSPAVTTVYTVNATTSDFCIASNSTTVTVNPSPTIQASSAKAEICRGESVQLTANGATTYSWNTGGTGSAITVSPNVNTTYTVTGVNSGGCSSSNTVSVKVNLCLGIGETSNQALTGILVFPNPSAGDFTVNSKVEISLTLSNQLGQVVKVIELNQGNNYQAKVEHLSPGVYFLTGEKDGLELNQKIIVNH